MPRDMKNYTDVNSRMKLASNTWQTIVVSPPVMLTDLAGYVTATVVLKDGRSVTEIAAFRLGLTGQSAQATFPIEDAATSAVGRALGRFGFGTDAHFPSREEMEQVERVQAQPQQTINANLKRKPESTPEQAAAKFWQHFEGVLGSREWSTVQRLLDTDQGEPSSVEGWRGAWKAVDAALAAELNNAA